MSGQWPSAAIISRLEDLRETVETLDKLPKGSGLVEVCLSRYLVVRAAGFIESVRDDAADNFATMHAHEIVGRRVREHLRGGLGVTPEQLKKFLRSFDPAWSTEFAAFISSDDGRLSNMLGPLVSARKKIAHGDGDNVIRERALAWAGGAQEVGEWLIRRFDPASV